MVSIAQLIRENGPVSPNSRPRFFPFGNGPVNEEGVAHYDDVIASMVELGIKPAVTLFHWGKNSESRSLHFAQLIFLDTPLALFNSYGAWTDPRIVDDFVSYAKFVISRYDEHVPIWYTFNERKSPLQTPQSVFDTNVQLNTAIGNTCTIPQETKRATIPHITV